MKGNGEIKIEKGVPLDRPRAKYPFKKMEVGDSFWLPGHNERKRGNLYQCAASAHMKIATRAEEVDGVKGLRCWRVA